MMFLSLFHRASLAILLSLVFGSQISFAQPDPQNAPKGENPAGRWDAEQLKARFQEWRETTVRKGLADVGVEDAIVQDEIVNYLDVRAEQNQKVQEGWTALYLELRAGEEDAQTEAAVGKYQTLLKEVALENSIALKQLDEKINYFENAKLRAVLALLGALGDGPSPLNNLSLMGHLAQTLKGAD